MPGIQVASLFGVLDLKDNMTPALDKARRGVAGFGTKVSSTGSQVSKLGSKVTLLTAPLAVLGGASVKAAVEWESAFAGVIKTVEGTDEELANLERGLRELATSADSPVSALSNAHLTLAAVAEAAGQLGVEQKYILEFSETMAMMGMATNLSAENAAVLAAQFANITGMDMTDIDRWGSSIVWLGNNSATTEAAIAEMAQRIAAAGTLAGLSEPQILGLASAVSSLGFDPEAGGTAISRVMNDITMWDQGGNTEKLQIMGNVAGVTGDEFATLWREDPMDAFLLFLEGLGKQDNAVGILDDLGWNSARLTPLLLSMSDNTSLVEEAVRGATDAWEDNNALTDEARKRAETTESAIKRLKNRAWDLGIIVGGVLLPPLAGLAEKLSIIAGNLADTNPEMLKAIVGFGLFAIALGPVLSIGGKLVTVLGALLTPIAGLALLLGLGLVKNWGDFAANLRQVGDAIEDKDLVGLLDGIAGALIDIPEGIAEWVGEMVGIDVPEGLEAWNGIVTNIQTIIKWLGDKAGELLGKIHFKIPQAFGDLLNVVNDIVRGIGEIAGFGGGDVNTMPLGAAESTGGIPQWGPLRLDARGQPTFFTGAGGTRDDGGSVSAGQAYLVGRGAQPELFVPSQSGTMYPAGTYGGTTIQIGAVYVQDEDPARWLDRLEREASRRNLTLGVARG